MRDPVDDPRPRILSVRFGVNPNSSSLGIDVTFLLFGGAAAVLSGLVASVLLRGHRKVELHGDPPTQAKP
jgi:hypothetical protein